MFVFNNHNHSFPPVLEPWTFPAEITQIHPEEWQDKWHDLFMCSQLISLLHPLWLHCVTSSNHDDVISYPWRLSRMLPPFLTRTSNTLFSCLILQKIALHCVYLNINAEEFHGWSLSLMKLFDKDLSVHWHFVDVAVVLLLLSWIRNCPSEILSWLYNGTYDFSIQEPVYFPVQQDTFLIAEEIKISWSGWGSLRDNCRAWSRKQACQTTLLVTVVIILAWH